VFDGHGGDQCAIYLRENLHIEIVKALTQPLDRGRPPLIESYDY
jgi:serine/threonine protein phosphatase PrpC